MIDTFWIEMHPPRLFFLYHFISIVMIPLLLIPPFNWLFYRKLSSLVRPYIALSLSFAHLFLGVLAAFQLRPFISAYRHQVSIHPNLVRDWDYLTSPTYWLLYWCIPALFLISSFIRLRMPLGKP